MDPIQYAFNGMLYLAIHTFVYELQVCLLTRQILKNTNYSPPIGVDWVIPL